MGTGTSLLHGLLLACGLLAAGFALRGRLGVLRRLHIPAAVVGGGVGFAVLQFGMLGGGGRTRETAASLAGELRSWPAPLIAVVFAGLLLERSTRGSAGDALRRGARSAALAWIIILGQIVAGLAVYLVFVRPARPQVPASFGQLLEVSWAGGHGASAAMGEVYASLGFPAGRDLAFFLATAGLVYGVVSGLVLVNLAIRRGWVSAAAGGRAIGLPPAPATDATPRESPRSPAERPARAADGLEPLALQVVILGAAFGVGVVLQQTFITVADVLLGPDNPAVSGEPGEFVRNVPLFLFTLLGGLLLRHVMQWIGAAERIDAAAVRRLVAVAVEFLVVAAVASIRVDALRGFWLAVAVLILAGAAWSVFCLLVLAPRLLPPAYWFELGLLNYGFSTANTPQGLMLLRIVDPEMKSGAAEDYAVAAPLSAPFVGGGVITVVALPLALQAAGPVWVGLTLVGAMVAIYGAGRWVARRGKDGG